MSSSARRTRSDRVRDRESLSIHGNSGSKCCCDNYSCISEAGIKNVDAYLFPCVPCGDGAKQVRDTNDALKSAGANYGMLWLDIERFKWNADKSTNQAFIKDMIDEASSLGIKTGIYAGYYSWEEIRIGLGLRQISSSVVCTL